MRRWLPSALVGAVVIASIGAVALSLQTSSGDPLQLESKVWSAGALPTGWTARGVTVVPTSAGLQGTCVGPFERAFGATLVVQQLMDRHSRHTLAVEELGWSPVATAVAAQNALRTALRCVDGSAPPSAPASYLLAGTHRAPALGAAGVYASLRYRQGPTTELQYYFLRDGVAASVFLVTPTRLSGGELEIVRLALQHL